MAESNLVLPTTMPADAIPLEGHQSSLPTAMPPDAIPLEVPQDAAPVADTPSSGGMFTDLLRSVTGAMFGNQVDNATPLGPVVMNDAGEFYKDAAGNLTALANTDFIAPDPKTGALTVFARNPSEGALGKARDVASAMAVGTASMAPEGVALKAANETATAADAAKGGLPGLAETPEAAPAGMAAPAPETPAGGLPTGSPDLQGRINGLMAGDRQIMTPEQLSLLQQSSGKETQGAAAALSSSATEPVVKEGLSRNVVGAFKDMLEAGQVKMVPGIKPTDQVLALMRSDILPPETYQAILKKWGVDPAEVVQSALGAGMRESAKIAGQTLQQLSDLQRVIGPKLTDSPEAAALLSAQKDDIGNVISSTMGQIRGIASRTMVAQLGTSIRNAIVSVQMAGIDTIDRAFEGTLRSMFGMTAASPDPIDVFGNWASLIRPGRANEITNAITSALPDVRQQLYGSYASDVIKATGGGPLAKVEKALDLVNFHGRFQEFFFRKAFFTAELERRLAGRGLNLDDLVDTNRLGAIPQEDLSAAADEALRMTFGRKLDNSFFDKMLRGVNVVQTIGGINPLPPIPFIRFVAAGTKWMFEHSPAGALRLLSKSERAALGPKGSLQVASRALTGSAMIYASYLARLNGWGGSDWYRVHVPGTNRELDVRSLNPVTYPIFVGDLLARYEMGTLAGVTAQQVLQGTIGADFRAGAGLQLADDLIQSLVNADSGTKATEVVKQFIGESVARFAVPFTMLKDFLAQGGMNVLGYDTSQERIVRDTKQSPLIGPTMGKIPGLDLMLPPLASPTRGGQVEQQVPISRQLGVPVATPQNPAEKELSRLNIQKKEVLPSSGDPATDRAVATVMGPLVEKAVGNLVKSPAYQKQDNSTKAYIVSQIVGDLHAAGVAALPADLALKNQYAKKGMRERIFLNNLFDKLPAERRDIIKNLLIR